MGRGGERQWANWQHSCGSRAWGLSPDDGQRDEVHQAGHDGHVRRPVGVIGPQGPALHLTVGQFPFPKYDQGGDGEQEREGPGRCDEHLGLLFCSKEREGGGASGNMAGEPSGVLCRRGLLCDRNSRPLGASISPSVKWGSETLRLGPMQGLKREGSHRNQHAAWHRSALPNFCFSPLSQI